MVSFNNLNIFIIAYLFLFLVSSTWLPQAHVLMYYFIFCEWAILSCLFVCIFQVFVGKETFEIFHGNSENEISFSPQGLVFLLSVVICLFTDFTE